MTQIKKINKLVSMSPEAHDLLKIAAMANGEFINDYLSSFVINNVPKYDLKPQQGVKKELASIY